MRRLKLILAYDGTNYAGMQRQINGLSIQEVVEMTLAKICNQEVQITPSGRTDAGVHALYQPVHLDFPIDSVELRGLIKAMNSLLPLDIRVLDASQASKSFHSRYDAKLRSYHYKICKNRTAFNYRHFSHFSGCNLDFYRFQPFLQRLLGEHNFVNFCKKTPNLKHHRCTIYKAQIAKKDYGWQIEISGNRFLHNMIRRIVGSCFVLCLENAKPEKISSFLLDKDIPTKYKFTAPAQGLYLQSVVY